MKAWKCVENIRYFGDSERSYGLINTVELTEVEAQEYRDHGVYLMDNYMSALYRAQD